MLHGETYAHSATDEKNTRHAFFRGRWTRRTIKVFVEYVSNRWGDCTGNIIHMAPHAAKRAAERLLGRLRRSAERAKESIVRVSEKEIRARLVSRAVRRANWAFDRMNSAWAEGKYTRAAKNLGRWVWRPVGRDYFAERNLEQRPIDQVAALTKAPAGLVVPVKALFGTKWGGRAVRASIGAVGVLGRSVGAVDDLLNGGFGVRGELERDQTRPSDDRAVRVPFEPRLPRGW